jgi:hypothetical protein
LKNVLKRQKTSNILILARGFSEVFGVRRCPYQNVESGKFVEIEIARQSPLPLVSVIDMAILEANMSPFLFSWYPLTFGVGKIDDRTSTVLERRALADRDAVMRITPAVARDEIADAGKWNLGKTNRQIVALNIALLIATSKNAVFENLFENVNRGDLRRIGIEERVYVRIVLEMACLPHALPREVNQPVAEVWPLFAYHGQSPTSCINSSGV